MASVPDSRSTWHPSDEPRTYTYRWMVASNSKDPMLPFSRRNGLLILLSALAMLVYGGWLVSSASPRPWLPVLIGIATLACGIFMTLRGRDISGNPLQVPLIRVWFSRKIVEFRFCPVYTNFWRATILEHFECRPEEIRGVELERVIQGVNSIPLPELKYAILRIWTTRGYIRISGERDELRGLQAAISEVASFSPRSFAKSRWLRVMVTFAVTAGILVVMWHLGVFP